MRISRVRIKNYRNLKDIDVETDKLTVLVGSNNSGKSNFLKAITLPFLNDEIGFNMKKLTWYDINDCAKEKFYKFILRNHKKFDSLKETFKKEIFEEVPKVSVIVDLVGDDNEEYYLKHLEYDLCTKNNEIKYGIEYIFSIKETNDFIEHIQKVIKSVGTADEDLELHLDNIKMNLLPINFYEYKIRVPFKNDSITFDKLKLFKYNNILAERDDFSRNEKSIGSEALLKLFDNRLDVEAKVRIEKQYHAFFHSLKDLSNIENIINWHENSNISNAEDFFSKISILPNMPPMRSILNSVKLGFDNQYLNFQGLGYRNLILLLVLINSLSTDIETAFSLLTIEEPEAHLCINNQKLMISFIKNIMTKNSTVQMFYSTHNSQFINKLNFNQLIFFSEGNVYPLSKITENQQEYFSRNPNTDLYNILFSRRCILVEGISEELLIKSYMHSKMELDDIEVISFHKGYTKILEIWNEINQNSNNRIAVIRDLDNQNKAREHHEKFSKVNANIIVVTTENYTLEDDIVNTDNNFDVLNKYFLSKEFTNGNNLFDSEEEMIKYWKDDKGGIMYHLSRDLQDNKINGFMMPEHIESAINQLIVDTNGEVKNES